MRQMRQGRNTIQTVAEQSRARGAEVQLRLRRPRNNDPAPRQLLHALEAIFVTVTGSESAANNRKRKPMSETEVKRCDGPCPFSNPNDCRCPPAIANEPASGSPQHSVDRGLRDSPVADSEPDRGNQLDAAIERFAELKGESDLKVKYHGGQHQYRSAWEWKIESDTWARAIAELKRQKANQS